MIHPPNEILHLLYYDEKLKEMSIREDATEEEKRIFKQFLQDVESGMLSDMEINFNLYYNLKEVIILKRLMFTSDTYRHAYSDDIEEDDFDYDEYFTIICIKIFEQEYDENFEVINELEIGIIEALLYSVDNAINNRERVVDVADSKNQEVSDAILKLFNLENNCLKDKYKGDIFTDNVFYLERLFIKPQYRSLGYGKFILKNIDKILFRLVIAEFTCIVMLPAAFEYAEPEEYKNVLNDSEIPDGKKITERLYKFYKRYGFKTVTGSRALYKIHG